MLRKSGTRHSEKIMLKQNVSATTGAIDLPGAAKHRVSNRMQLLKAPSYQHQGGPAVDIEAALQRQRLVGSDHRIGL